MRSLVPVLFAAVVLPATVNAEPIATSSSFSGRLSLPPVELDASELGLHASGWLTRPLHAESPSSELQAGIPPESSVPAIAETLPNLRTIVIIESDRGVHLIESDPVTRPSP